VVLYLRQSEHGLDLIHQLRTYAVMQERGVSKAEAVPVGGFRERPLVAYAPSLWGGFRERPLCRLRSTLSLRPLIKKLTVVEEPEFARRYPAESCTRIEVTTTDGRHVTAETHYPKGHRPR
jgi:hypothetical protein